jgi:hypothetical protein
MKIARPGCAQEKLGPKDSGILVRPAAIRLEQVRATKLLAWKKAGFARVAQIE